MNPDVAQLINLIQSQLNTQGRLLWVQLVILIAYTVATIALAIIGILQIKGYKKDKKDQAEKEKKWKTVEACESLDVSVKFDDFNRAISKKCESGKAGFIDYTYDNMKQVEIDIKGLLNCLDSLAIGVIEFVYNEEIIRDHYEQILKDAVELFILCKFDENEKSKILLDRPVVREDDFVCLLKVYKKWKTNQRKPGIHYCEGS